MKKILACIVIVYLSVCCLQNVCASIVIEDPSHIGTGTIDDDLKVALGGTWATISVIIQICAVGCVVFAGIRYMFVSADKRADIKNGMKNLAIGGVLVFVTIPVIKFVATTARELMPKVQKFNLQSATYYTIDSIKGTHEVYLQFDNINSITGIDLRMNHQLSKEVVSNGIILYRNDNVVRVLIPEGVRKNHASRVGETMNFWVDVFLDDGSKETVKIVAKCVPNQAFYN